MGIVAHWYIMFGVAEGSGDIRPSLTPYVDAMTTTEQAPSPAVPIVGVC
jgi:hypothetical protein